MSTTVYFYNCFVLHNGEYTDISFSDIIDKIIVRDPIERYKSIKQGNLCLLGLMQPNENSTDYRDRKIVIAKYRENKPYLGNIGTDRIDEIPDDVLELTSAFFIPSSHMVMVEYNHQGCRPRGLEQYLSSFLPSLQDDSWSVVFEPIENDIGFTDVQNSRDIRKLVFSLDLSNRDRTIHRENVYESLFGNIIQTTIESHIDFGANTATIGFSNGRGKRDRVLEPQRLIDLISLLNLDSDLFEAVKVKYYSPNRGRVEEIDLKKHGILQKSLDIEDNSGWELICNTIEDQFYTKGRAGKDNHHNFEIRASHLPDLVYNVRRE
jgi:hypothetical protein